MNAVGWRYAWATTLALLIAVVFQPIALNWRIGPARPDVLLVVTLCCALLSDRVIGAILGFITGLTYGALIGKTIAELTISRILAGFFAGWVPTFVLREYLITAIIVVVSGTIIAETVFLLLHPENFHFGSWSIKTIATAAYNGVVAIPVYALLRRVVPPVQN